MSNEKIERDVKMVIVWRNDIKCRSGKKMAQAGHSVMAWLTNRIISGYVGGSAGEYELHLSPAEEAWINGPFAKITLQVDNEKQLLEIYDAAQKADLQVVIIKDAGRTEFNGIETITCIGIGPDYCDKIDSITKHLKLH